jgi:1,4-dihydroxy-2-naphthoyl-CoA hydrolase
MIDKAAMQAYLDKLFPGLLGIRLEELAPDKVVGSMEVRADLCTAGEMLHGGVYMAFADTLGAVATVINMPRGARTVTIESKTNFLNGAAIGSRVTGETTAFHKGRNTMVWQTRVLREDGKLCAVVTQTQMVMPGGG